MVRPHREMKLKDRATFGILGEILSVRLCSLDFCQEFSMYIVLQILNIITY